jgi:RNA recognition motif-containing protein
MKLFVAGLPADMDEAELEEFFEKYGPVKTVSIARKYGQPSTISILFLSNTQVDLL